MALTPLAMPSKVNTRKRRSSSLHRLDVNVTARPISDSPRLQHQPAVKRKMFNLLLLLLFLNLFRALSKKIKCRARRNTYNQHKSKISQAFGRSTEYTQENRCFLSSDLNSPRVEQDFTHPGREFQILGAATEKARSP